ncbi:MAG TPA: nucleotidyltransferase [bacterium]|nr:nucleotidyltransferase family protein [bacterium]HDP98547.1 nucleotidyltransferase [bacterium]
MTKKNILKILKSVKQEVRYQYKAELKGIFGSYSRDEQSEGSDVDILVRFLPGATLIDLSGLGNFLEQRLQSKVDIVSERALRKEIESYVNNDLVAI